MLDRRYLKDLVNWMNRDRRKPLMVWGARQVGKTYLVKDIFAERFYKDRYVYIDCRVENDFCRYCEKNTNPKDILNYISLDKGLTIGPDTLLIFDEAQECLPIVTLMKYFCQDYGEIPIIVTGSMVRIRIKRKKRGVADNGFLFPIGKINELTITPMSFDEYLYNRNRPMYDAIIRFYNERKPMEQAFHDKAMSLFHEYLLIGGMPEAVDTFLRTENFNEVRTVLMGLYGNYLADMELYQASQESIVRSRAVFSSIYSQLSKESKNFKPSLVEKGSRTRDLRSPLDWLSEAHVVNIAKQLDEHVSFPFMEKEGLFRIYLGDVGMFTFQSNVNPVSLVSEDGRNTLSGIFYENFVAEELTSRGFPLFYWRGKGDSEFEFILDHGGYAIPVDVKKRKGPLRSLDRFMEHNRFDYAVKVSGNNYGFDESRRILTIPFYQFFLYMDSLLEERRLSMESLPLCNGPDTDVGLS